LLKSENKLEAIKALRNLSQVFLVGSYLESFLTSKEIKEYEEEHEDCMKEALRKVN